jgi:hypothetical protein
MIFHYLDKSSQCPLRVSPRENDIGLFSQIPIELRIVSPAASGPRHPFGEGLFFAACRAPQVKAGHLAAKGLGRGQVSAGRVLLLAKNHGATTWRAKKSKCILLATKTFFILKSPVTTFPSARPFPLSTRSPFLNISQRPFTDFLSVSVAVNIQFLTVWTDQAATSC